MSDDLVKAAVGHEDRQGVRVVHIREKKLAWTVDPGHLKSALLEAVAGADRAAVDFGEVAYMSSPTIGTILSFSRQAETDGCKVVSCGMQPYVYETFVALRLDRVLTICRTIEDAIAHLTG